VAKNSSQKCLRMLRILRFKLKMIRCIESFESLLKRATIEMRLKIPELEYEMPEFELEPLEFKLASLEFELEPLEFELDVLDFRLEPLELKLNIEDT